MSVSFQCSVVLGKSLCDGPIPRPEESYWLWCVILCDIETSSMWRPWPALGCCAKTTKTPSQIRPGFLSCSPYEIYQLHTNGVTTTRLPRVDCKIYVGNLQAIHPRRLPIKNNTQYT
jgi:hypothetical protein